MQMGGGATSAESQLMSSDEVHSGTVGNANVR